MASDPPVSETVHEHAIPISCIATCDVETLPVDASMREATAIMATRKISSILVTERDNHPLGIVTEQNILHAMRTGRALDTRLNEVMSSPIVTVLDKTSCEEAYLLCLSKGIRHLALHDDKGNLSGVVSETDFRQHVNLTALAGKRQVAAVMTRSVLSLPPEANLQKAVELMEDHHDNCVVVTENQYPVGIVTERDLVRLFSEQEEGVTSSLGEVMTCPVRTVPSDATVTEAAELMLETGMRHLVVIDSSGNLAGLASEHDLTQIMMLGSIDVQLESERAFLRALIDTIPDLVWLKDPDGVYLACNPRFETMYGAKEEDIVGKTDYDFVDAEMADFFRENDCKALNKGGPRINEEWLTFVEDGHKELTETIKTPMRDAQGRLIGVLGIGRDITQVRQDQKALRESEERVRLAAHVFTDTQEGIVITDPEARIVEVNASFSRITGYEREEVLGENPSLLKSGHQDRAFYQDMWQSIKSNGHWSGEVWNRRKDGQVYAEHLAISTVYDDAGEVSHYVGVFADITPQKEHEKQLERIAHYDALTSVPNRVLLSERMGWAIEQTKRDSSSMAVCYLDLDGFKPINDQFGHESGDHLLVEISRRIKNCLRGNDTIARIGGDEFVLLLLGIKRVEECETALRRLLEAISRPWPIGDMQITLSASIGATLFPNDDVDADTLLRHADQAMYMAKEAGRNCYHMFDAEHDRQVKAHKEQQERLREALEVGEFRLHYQPKVNMINGELLGVEALIRWQHPQDGLLLPAEFLSYIQSSDLEVALGEWVIESALKQLEVWQEQGAEIAVSVNIGAEHLLQENFAERLEVILQHHPTIDPNRLELEILESTAIVDIHQASKTLLACRKLGVRFALDDFGTGYSSLTYFRQLPVETLKIDQSFVMGMLEDPDDMGIVESVVQLTQAFNRTVVAEGAETHEHCAMLSRMRCHAAQGYGIARPMPPEQLGGWIREWVEQETWLQFADNPHPLQCAELVLEQAIGSHRAWIDNLVAYLQDIDNVNEPVLDPNQCLFGMWYRHTGCFRYGHMQEFVDIDPIHEQAHELAQELCSLVRRGPSQKQEVQQRLSELYVLRDRLFAAMLVLIEAMKDS